MPRQTGESDGAAAEDADPITASRQSLPRRIWTWFNSQGLIAKFLVSIVTAVATALVVGAVTRVVFSDDSNADAPTTSKANAASLAALVRQGPFSKELPRSFTVAETGDASIGDASAVHRYDAVEFTLDHSERENLQTYVHLEIYRTEAEAAQRGRARVAELRRLYGTEQVVGNATSYCADLAPNPAWECGGTSGLAYAETTLSPSGNANRPVAVGITSAVLAYTDEKGAVAAN